MCGFTNCLAQGASQEPSGKEQEPAPNGGQEGRKVGWQAGRRTLLEGCVCRGGGHLCSFRTTATLQDAFVITVLPQVSEMSRLEEAPLAIS